MMIANKISRQVRNRRSFDNRLKRARSLQLSDFVSSNVGMDDDNDIA
jgi:hypothetical protein